MHRQRAVAASVPEVKALDLRLEMRSLVQFDAAWKEHLTTLLQSVGEYTEDTTEDSIFSRAFAIVEIAEGKSALLEHLRTASGIDAKGYADILRIPNEDLAQLLTECLQKRMIPTAWLTTLLVAVPKAKGPYNDPENFRMIALECCLLKLMTMLLDRRMREFVDRNNLLPASQNGFRPGYRTENNPFILRSVIETAWSQKKHAYVAFVDLRNAFPSVDHTMLWHKMWQMGICGPVFDWLRKLYSDMRYRLRQGDGLSEEMAAKLGILMGDPGSPLAFLLYIADFETPIHPDDISLAGSIIAHLEHADDMVLMSSSPEGLQQKLDALGAWAARNHMEINAKKTVVMLLARPRAKVAEPLLPFTIYGDPLSIVKEQCYVGVWFSSSGNIWESHFHKHAQKARRAANITFFVESHTGPLPPEQGRSLYTAQVDPHLTWAAEVTGIGTLAQQAKLDAVQLAYVRRLLGVQKRSQRCILFTETGLWPLLFRRLYLQLKYLKYVLEQPDTHYVRIALKAQSDLHADSGSGWLSDLRRQLYNVGVQAPDTLDPPAVDEVLSKLKIAMQESLSTEVHNSAKLEILHSRVDYSAKGRTRSPVLKFRDYLRISDQAIRRAITRLLVSDHRLSIETLRRASADRPYTIPRESRLCRFCLSAVEEPLHALFNCTGSLELTKCRSDFWDICTQARPQSATVAAENRSQKKQGPLVPPIDTVRGMTPSETLFALLACDSTARALAGFTLRVLEIYDKTELYVPYREPDWDSASHGEN